MKIYAGDRNFMKTPKKKTPIKDFLKKGTVKGIKFVGKTAISPLTLAFAGGAGIVRQFKRELGEQPIKRTATRKFNRKGISVL
jgi:hypothetical protein